MHQQHRSPWSLRAAEVLELEPVQELVRALEQRQQELVLGQPQELVLEPVQEEQSRHRNQRQR
jgi:hypothetical protein